MPDLLALSHLLLWSGFISIAIINLAMLRQFGVLFERVAPAGALAMNEQLHVGDEAPQLSVISLSGEMIAIGGAAQRAHSTLLFFASPTCSICGSLLPVMKRLDRQWNQVEVVYGSAGEEVQAHEKFIAKHQLPRARYVISDELGMAFGVSKLPYAVLIDPSGHISAFGLVNTREHLESLMEAQTAQVASLQDFIKKNELREGGDYVQDKP